MNRSLDLIGRSMVLAITLAVALVGCSDGADKEPTDTPDASDVDSGEDAATCSNAGDACGAAEDCCSGVCESDICVDPYGECAPVTQNCEASSDCCSGNCAPSTKCVNAADACVATGESCNGHYQCCSGSCGNGVCTEPFGSCLFNGVDCASNTQCCSGICGGTCEMADIGVACVNLGNACTLGMTTCCNGGQCQGSICVLKAGDCQPQDGGCTESFECCTGFCSNDNVCTNPPA